MFKLVDVDALKQEIKKSKNLGVSDIHEVLGIIDNFLLQPASELSPSSPSDCDASDAIVTKGEWLVKNKGTTHYFYCSECNAAGDFFDHYCRNCGAIMDASKNNK